MPASTPAAVAASTRSSLVDPLLWLLPPIVTTLHAVFSPFTKVEESFTLHALHDFLYRGFVVSSHWDHVEFPGPLPRSFLPAALLSLFVRPILALVRVAGPRLERLLPGLQLSQVAAVSTNGQPADFMLDKFAVQVLARVTLGLLSSASLLYVGRQVRLRHGVTAQRLYVLLSVTQFHIMYYSSRTLPNFTALPFVNLAFGLVLSPERASSRRQGLPNREGLALILLAATTTIIRSELACLLGPLTLALIARRRLSLAQAVVCGAVGGFGGTALTVGVDSYYWNHWTWPEAYGVWFNVYRNESAKWGTSPWHYYLKHLPLLLLAAAPLLLLSGAVRAVRRRVDWTVCVLPAAVMVAALSALGHKEWRFVAYVVPWLNVPAAVMAAHLWQSAAPPSPVLVRLLLCSVVVGALAANAVAAGGLLWISSSNYPGGELMLGAMREELLRADGQSVHLYSPSLPLQTGSTLFLAASTAPADALRAVFNKTELAEPLMPEIARGQSQWTHVILPSGTEDEVAAWLAPPDAGEVGWVEVARASGFGGFDVRRGPPRAKPDTSAVGSGPWVALGGEDGVGAGWGSVGATVRMREGERCVLVRRADWPRRSG